MVIRIVKLAEPNLEFAGKFKTSDPRNGLTMFGPLGKSLDGFHREAIRVGFVGTIETISNAKAWLEECSKKVESDKLITVVDKSISQLDESQTVLDIIDNTYVKGSYSRLEKILTPDFIGFNSDSQFNCKFAFNKLWVQEIKSAEINERINIENPQDRIIKLVDLFVEVIRNLASVTPSPDVVIVALPDEILESAATVAVSGNYYLNFRRLLKAKVMDFDMPTQIIKNSTAKGVSKSIQDKATRAWNLCTAMYYKNDGIPWRAVELQEDTCYIGISFYVAKDLNDEVSVRACIAQAFDHLGQGMVTRGAPFEWNSRSMGRIPHLKRERACSVIKDALVQYENIVRRPPSRVVIHKSSTFWGRGKPEYNEIEGFIEGVQSIYSRATVDLVALRTRPQDTFLVREGKYPPLRGTIFSFDEKDHFLYTGGYIPQFSTSPGSHIPKPIHLSQFHGETPPIDLLREILSLTKLNFNNCAYGESKPITLSFSDKIGDVLKHISGDSKLQSKFYYYI